MNIIADFIVNAGILVCCDETNQVLYDQSVLIRDGKIVGIIPQSEFLKSVSSSNNTPQVIHAEKQIVLPGFVNTHTHIPMSYFKGLADDLPLDRWLNDYIWPTEARFIKPEFVYHASLHGIGELLKNGITFFHDMYFIPSKTVKAVRETGIRALIGAVVCDAPMGDYYSPEKVYAPTQDCLDAMAESDLIELNISPHSVYVCGEAQWKRAIAVAREKGLILHTHLCETEKEVVDFKERYGVTPVRWLYDLGAFEGRFVMAHGVHLSDDDFELLEGKDVSVAINLHSNLKLASGIPPIQKYLQHGINVSFGTDGVASNNSLSISDEISTAAKLYKAIHNDPTFLPAKDLVRMATYGGAKALGKEDVTGSIEIGKAADMITIDIDNFQCQPVFDPFSYIVYGMNRERISNVIVGGKILMAERKLTTLDEEQLLSQARENAEKIIYNS